MKAIQLQTYGGPDVLKVQTCNHPQLKKGQALIKMEVAGVNFIDVYHRKGMYPVQLPYVLGLEGSGIVEAVDEQVSHLRPGDRVAFANQPGAYAEYCVVDASQMITLPPSISFELGATFPLQGMTAHYLLHEFKRVKAGDVVLIHAAAGGMGLLLVQWAKHLGARVLGTVSSEDKGKIAKEAGADEIILYTKHNFVDEVKRLTDGRGVDLIIDGIGKTTFPGDLEAAALRGTIIIFGAASGQADPISPNILMKRSLTVSGGSIFNFLLTKEELQMRAKAVLQGIQEGWLKMRVDMTLPLEKAFQAHQKLEDRQTRGKVLLKIGD